MRVAPIVRLLETESLKHPKQITQLKEWAEDVEDRLEYLQARIVELEIELGNRDATERD